jgi:hypothetical protein
MLLMEVMWAFQNRDSKAGWFDPSTPFAGEPFINILDRDEQAHLSALLAKLVSQGRT